MLKIIVTPDGDLALGVEENGIESCEALLLARHYMHKRLYQYSSVKSYSYHLARFMETIYYDLGEDLDRYIAMTDNEVLSELNIASRDESHPGHFDAKCLYLRNYRFRAIPLLVPPVEADLLALKEKLGDEIDWELSATTEKRIGLPFPVLKQDGTIDIGDNLSEISVPPKERSWVYVAPRYEQEVRQTLNHVDVIG